MAFKRCRAIKRATHARDAHGRTHARPRNRYHEIVGAFFHDAAQLRRPTIAFPFSPADPEKRKGASAKGEARSRARSQNWNLNSSELRPRGSPCGRRINLPELTVVRGNTPVSIAAISILLDNINPS